MTRRFGMTLARGALAVGLAVAAAGAGAPPASAQSRLDRLIDACRDYAGDAVRAERANRRRNCGLHGPRWSSSAVRHFRWCVSASPPARRREARARADELRECRGRRQACTAEFRPVCAVRGGNRRTYPNACRARAAGARIVSRGRCGRAGPGPEPGPGRNCRLRNARLTVSSPGCSPRTLRLGFDRPVLRHGHTIERSLDSGTIGKGYGPWGVCNFHSRIRYVCRDGRLKVQHVFVCRQARTNPRSANCSVDN